MVYVDTSVMVALHFPEVGSSAAADWLEKCEEALFASSWCVTEFASAIMIKRRTGQISIEQADGAWAHFERFCSQGVRLAPPDPAVFHLAATLIRASDRGLRAGDALHLAAALTAQCDSIATLDGVLADDALRSGLKLATICSHQSASPP